MKNNVMEFSIIFNNFFFTYFFTWLVEFIIFFKFSTTEPFDKFFSDEILIILYLKIKIIKIIIIENRKNIN